MSKTCAFHGCEAPARLRYCCDAHGNAHRQAVSRERRVIAELEITVGPVEEPIRYERIYRRPQAFGVLTTPEVAFVFKDDEERFAHAAIANRRFRIEVA